LRSFLIKGGIIASLYFLHCWTANANEVTALTSPTRLSELAKSVAWKALLHAKQNHSYISDQHFFLSHKTFNPESELTASLKAFQQPIDLGNAHPICRFPARFHWLRSKLNLSRERFPHPVCSQYQEFIEKVPVASIALVFASANVTSPSSMMGHAFLKLSGINKKDIHVDHAVTYFTLLNSYNVPKIVYQNFAGGMQGFFALQPYSRLRKNYLQREHRNLWEYTLNITREQKLLIRDHVWELKNIKSNYLFAEYNCATLTWYFMQLIAPESFKHSLKAWVTPIDIVKMASHAKLIGHTQVITSNQWKLLMLLEQTGVSSKKMRFKLMHTSPQQTDTYVQSLSPGEKLLTLSYLEYLDQNNRPERNQIPAFISIKQKLSMQTSDYQLDYTHYKQPTKVPGNSQIRIEAGQSSLNSTFVGLSYLPAANRLTDDQRQFFSATELRLAEVSARLYKGSKLRLEQFTLYGMKRLSPWNGLTKSMSGQWHTGLERQPDALMNQRLVYNLSGGIGYSVKLGNDAIVYGLYNLGLAADFSRAYIYHYPEVGLQLEELYHMKTSLSYEARFNSYGAKQRIDFIRACQSYYPSTNFTWLACYKSAKNSKHSSHEGNIQFQAHF